MPPPENPADSECAPADPDARDVYWMERICQGDMEALEALIEHHQGRVIGTITKMLGDAGEAEDIGQQVFLRVWKAAKSYRPGAKFTTWLLTITRNLVFNEMRRRKRKPFQSLEAAEESGMPIRGEEESASPASQVLQAELENAIQDAISALPEQQRMALVLRRYEDLAYEDIAAVMKISVSSVKSLLFRARTELRDRLAKYL